MTSARSITCLAAGRVYARTRRPLADKSRQYISRTPLNGSLAKLNHQSLAHPLIASIPIQTTRLSRLTLQKNPCSTRTRYLYILISSRIKI